MFRWATLYLVPNDEGDDGFVDFYATVDADRDIVGIDSTLGYGNGTKYPITTTVLNEAVYLMWRVNGIALSGSVTFNCIDDEDGDPPGDSFIPTGFPEPSVYELTKLNPTLNFAGASGAPTETWGERVNEFGVGDSNPWVVASPVMTDVDDLGTARVLLLRVVYEEGYFWTGSEFELPPYDEDSPEAEIEVSQEVQLRVTTDMDWSNQVITVSDTVPAQIYLARAAVTIETRTRFIVHENTLTAEEQLEVNPGSVGTGAWTTWGEPDGRVYRFSGRGRTHQFSEDNESPFDLEFGFINQFAVSLNDIDDSDIASWNGYMVTGVEEGEDDFYDGSVVITNLTYKVDMLTTEPSPAPGY